MKRNGYTLVELLAVVVILSVLTLIVVPTVIKVFEQADKQLSVTNVTLIQVAAQNYIEENRENFPILEKSGGKVTITVDTLKTYGYLPKIPVDSVTNKPISITTEIKITNNNGKFEYEVLYP